MAQAGGRRLPSTGVSLGASASTSRCSPGRKARVLPRVLQTCTLLTTAANAVLAPIHGRMPVILPQDAFGLWLSGKAAPLVPCPPEAPSACRVGPLVNHPGNDDPRCVEPLAGE